MGTLIAINERSRRTFTVTLQLSGTDYEWLAAYAEIKGYSLDDSVSRMIAGSLNEDPVQWFDIQRLLDSSR